MSVIVPMEMPKSCYSEDEFCPFHTFVFDLNGGKNICTQLEKTASRDKRLEECPLIELPETHGRLKDADKILDKLREYLQSALSHEPNIANRIYEIICDAPTVLEASET